MRRHLLIAVVIAIAVAASTASAAPIRTPSDRGCLLAWNARTNHANRLRVLADRPIRGLSLLPGRGFSYMWTKGSVRKQTSADVCVLTLAKPGRIQLVTGLWKAGHVTSWSFGRRIPTNKPFFTNVRLLADGRVTKIYRR